MAVAPATENNQSADRQSEDRDDYMHWNAHIKKHRSKLCEDAETFNAKPSIFATWL